MPTDHPSPPLRRGSRCQVYRQKEPDDPLHWKQSQNDPGEQIHRLFPLIFAALVGTAGADDETLSLEEFRQFEPMAEIMILGTFHFRDKGLDGYKPEVDIDIFSEQRQAELRAILDRIKTRFDPTKIALEARGEWAEEMTATEYPAWLRGEFELKANEVYQVGFRLGKELGHDRLHFVDVMGRRYEGLPEDIEAYAKRIGQQDYLTSPWDARYEMLYRHGDRAKARRPLTETFLAMNDPERLMAGHGHYLLQVIALGEDDEYVGADVITGWWYNRNLRIFANIRRLAEPGDRILLVIGAGHVPILLHAAQASPEFKVVTVAEVLGE